MSLAAPLSVYRSKVLDVQKTSHRDSMGQPKDTSVILAKLLSDVTLPLKVLIQGRDTCLPLHYTGT